MTLKKSIAEVRTLMGSLEQRGLTEAEATAILNDVFSGRDFLADATEWSTERLVEEFARTKGAAAIWLEEWGDAGGFVSELDRLSALLVKRGVDPASIPAMSPAS